LIRSAQHCLPLVLIVQLHGKLGRTIQRLRKSRQLTHKSYGRFFIYRHTTRPSKIVEAGAWKPIRIIHERAKALHPALFQHFAAVTILAACAASRVMVAASRPWACSEL
jgi:hypothetical protein